MNDTNPNPMSLSLDAILELSHADAILYITLLERLDKMMILTSLRERATGADEKAWDLKNAWDNHLKPKIKVDLSPIAVRVKCLDNLPRRPLTPTATSTPL